jgi:exo-beta-1,3-glucanase (GH17 family)
MPRRLAPSNPNPPPACSPQRCAAPLRGRRLWPALGSLILLQACTAAAPRAAEPDAPPPAAGPRPLPLPPGTGWTGNGVAYGPHRAGQHPDGLQPSRAELLEDLRLIQRHWHWLRMYGARGATETVAELIRAERLPLRLVVGAWIMPEPEEAPGSVARAANQAEVSAAIRLANTYPDVVSAVSVGNETQVFWSSHKVAPERLLAYIRTVRANTSVPVTTADDFRFWTTPESRPFAAEVDFLMVHVYAMWNGQSLADALSFTREQLAAVAAVHPGRTLVLGEAGWATCKHNAGDQATLIRGVPGEAEQKAFHEQFTRWTTEERIPNFYFEAFDEPWKGGQHPDEVEKHWGLFRADRTPKAALQR